MGSTCPDPPELAVLLSPSPNHVLTCIFEGTTSYNDHKAHSSLHLHIYIQSKSLYIPTNISLGVSQEVLDI
eukprot:c42826_g1_i1 orf=1-210(-)